MANFLTTQRSKPQNTPKRRLSVHSAASSPVLKKKVRTESLVSQSSATHESKDKTTVPTRLAMPGKLDLPKIDRAPNNIHRPASIAAQSDAVRNTRDSSTHPIRADSIKRSPPLQTPSGRAPAAQISMPSTVNTPSGSQRVPTNSWYNSKTPLSNKHTPQCPTSMPPPRAATKVQGSSTPYSTAGGVPESASWRLMTSNQAPFKAPTIPPETSSNTPLLHLNRSGLTLVKMGMGPRETKRNNRSPRPVSYHFTHMAHMLT
jgi:hypothetical protein